ncbi:PilZ domain-containing protein [Paucidesulfovibrio longus]|uniref:PilZ domain-containing protein n=1 Tax=Paucidesulfovibrio longus TaxID=889 RepID=UPI000405A228|nr:flagellar brake protein [Paucidesulfovibrio longus]
MDISIGAAVMMESSSALDRIKCHMVGFQRDEFVVLKLPLVPGIRSRVPEGAMLTFRYLQRGRLVSFRSVVKHYAATPYSLLFLTYPKRFEQHDLRREQRFTCNFPATLHFLDRDYKGLLLDLSTGGCRFFFDDQAGPPPPNLRRGSKVRGEYRPPNSSSLEFQAEVASLEGYRTTRTVSLRFGEDDMPLPPDLADFLLETQVLLDRMYALGNEL